MSPTASPSNPNRMPHADVGFQIGAGVLMNAVGEVTGTSPTGYYLMTLVTWPAPTVRPPSRMANFRPSSMAIGWIS